ncbi:MAG: hypothetical protein CMA66_03195 [Euryarchaeota archaeon]|nr:hypothetical protein [Euryarchaeota archaeon]
MAELKGFVQYRFRSDEHDAEVLLRGDADWVRKKVSELGLQGVGWMMPLGSEVKASNNSGVSSKNKSGPAKELDDDSLGEKPLDMGPAPDPSRIPIVRRPIGELDLSKELRALGLDDLTKPDPIELMEIFSELDEPLPVQGTLSIDPMAEAWLRELMNIVVRDYGFTALKTSDIEEIASSKLGKREGTALEVWLESLFTAGKLVKVHGGDAVGWGPSPRWLAGKV